MRRAAKVDRNQVEVVQAMRAAGATVQCLHMVGQGCPDLLWSKNGFTGVMEIKDGQKPPGRWALNTYEWVWREAWQGRYDIILSAEDAIKVLSEVP